MSARSSAGSSARTSRRSSSAGPRGGGRVVGVELAGGGGDLLAVELVEDVLAGPPRRDRSAPRDRGRCFRMPTSRRAACSETCSSTSAWPAALRSASSALTSSLAILGKRVLDALDQVRRHLIEGIAVGAHPRASARRWASTTLSAVMLTMPRAVTDGVRTCAGRAVPSSIGPTCSPSAAVFSRLKAMLAASRFGRSAGWPHPSAASSGTRSGGSPDRARRRRASRPRPRAPARACAAARPPRRILRAEGCRSCRKRVRQQRHLGLDAEAQHRVGREQRDLGERPRRPDPG